MRFAALTKDGTAKAPAPGAAGKVLFKGAGGFSLQAFEETQIGCALTEEALCVLRHKTLAGAIQKAQALVAIESKDRDIDLGHNGGQQRAGFHGSEALLTQHLGKRIDLDHEFAESVAAFRATHAKGKVAFAQGRLHIRERLQGMNHGGANGESEAEPNQDYEKGEAPAGTGVVVAGPQQDHGQQKRA